MSISKQGTIWKPLHSTLRPSSKTLTTPLFIGTYIYRLKIYCCFICWFSSVKFDMGSKCHFYWLATQFTWLIHLGSYWIWIILLIISVWTCFVMNLLSRNLKLCAFVYVEKQMNFFYCSRCLCVSFWTLPGDSWHLHFIICTLLIMMPRLHEYSFILFSAPRLRQHFVACMNF